MTELSQPRGNEANLISSLPTRTNVSPRQELLAYLNENRINLQTMTLRQFRTWLGNLMDRESHRPEYQHRLKLRELETEHQRSLTVVRRQRREADAAWQASGGADQLARLDGQLRGVEQAVTGLTAAVAAGDAAPEKLAEFQSRLDRLTAERDQLLANSKPWQKLTRRSQAVDDFYDQIGLTVTRGLLEQAERGRGHANVASGRQSEDDSLAPVRELLPWMIDEKTSPEELIILTGVTLGAARAELDLLVVSRSATNESLATRRSTEENDRFRGLTPAARLADGDGPVTVHAVVEVKRNPNDLVHGFRMRQENLAFFTGDPNGYEADDYRTSEFRVGHFDRPSVHHEHDQAYLFDKTSFRLFVRGDEGYFLDRLWFVTRRWNLDGVTGEERSRIVHAALGERGFRLESDTILRRLMTWSKAMVQPFQTRDILELYTSNSDRARQIVFLP